MRSDMAVDGVVCQVVNDEASTDSSAADAHRTPGTPIGWPNAGTGVPRREITFHFKTAALKRVDFGDELALNRSGMCRCCCLQKSDQKTRSM